MPVLEVEGKELFGGIEAAPSEEDTDADAGEDAGAPERIWNERGSVETFLMLNPDDEGRNEGKRDDQESQIARVGY